MRAHTNISRKERNTLVLTDFKGADFSSSPLSVRSNRAIVMRNFINENGVNQKRNGWEEIEFPEYFDASTGTYIKPSGYINGIFEWYGEVYQVNPFETRQVRHLLVHAGRYIYRYTFVYGTSNNTIQWSVTENPIRWTNPTESYHRSQAFFMNKKLYIIGLGGILEYDGVSIQQVTPYTPTTTISINHDEVQGTRASFEGVNMLSPYRKNTLVGTSEEGKTWTLDASIDSLTLIEVTTKEGDNYIKYDIKPTGTNRELKVDKKYKMENGVYRVDTEATTGTIVGSYDNNSPEGHGRIRLTIATEPVIEGADNITVEFMHTVDGYADRINNCRFGCLFGANGNNDRLFLSGNIDYPNVEFYSAAGDFGYFPDQNTVTLGSSIPITGMVRLSDGAMAVLKKPNTQEATIYYATGEYDIAKTESGQVVNMTALFPHSAGGIGEGLVSSRACVNFLGDPLIVSPNGVQGILLSQNVSTTERYTRERSRLIDEELKTKNLDYAQAVVYKNRCYIAVDNVCYVADARYKFVADDDIDGSYNYEWWYWDNIPVRVWATIGDELWFGTSDGKVCCFRSGYIDKSKVYFDEVSFSIQDGGIESSGEGLAVGDKLAFSNPIHAIIEADVNAADGVFEIQDRDWIVDGQKVVVEGGLTAGAVYTVTDVDYGTMTHRLMRDGAYVNASGLFSLYVVVNEGIIADISNNLLKLKLTPEGKTLSLQRYNDENWNDIRVTGRREQNVVAEWYTPMFDLGTNMYSKTLERISAATEGTSGGAIKIGYITRQTEDMVNLKVKGVNSIDLNNFAFDDFVFDSTFANSYTRYVNVRNFNYIMFRFVSDNDKNCAVHNMTVQYKINNLNKGVK